MARPKKSAFYHIRLNKVGINEETAANVIGVDVKQIKEWDAAGAPVYVERLLLLWDRKHIGHPGWDGWLFSRGALVHKKKRWLADNLLEQRDSERLLFETQCELERARTWRGFIKSQIKGIRKLKKLKVNS